MNNCAGMAATTLLIGVAIGIVIGLILAAFAVMTNEESDPLEQKLDEYEEQRAVR